MKKKSKAKKYLYAIRLIVIGLLIGVISWSMFTIANDSITSLAIRFGFDNGYVLNIGIILTSLVFLFILGIKPYKALEGKK